MIEWYDLFHPHAKPNPAKLWHGFVAHIYCGGGQHSATDSRLPSSGKRAKGEKKLLKFKNITTFDVATVGSFRPLSENLSDFEFFRLLVVIKWITLNTPLPNRLVLIDF